MPIEQEQSKKPAHPPVSVIERVNAEKIKNKKNGKQQRIVNFPLHRTVVRLAKPRHCLRRFKGGHRRKTDMVFTLIILFRNAVVTVFPMAADAGRLERIKIPVELQDCIRCNRNEFIIFMNGRQDIPIPCNLFFAPGRRFRLLHNKLFQTAVRSKNSFHTVRGFRALDNRHLQQRVKHIFLRGNKEFLPPPELMNCRQQIADFRRQQLPWYSRIVKKSHDSPLSSFCPYYIFFLHNLQVKLCRKRKSLGRTGDYLELKVSMMPRM